MSSEIRTFIVPDIDNEEAQARVGAFLRSVEVERIDTAFAEGAWRILVVYQDLKRREETRQIEVAIAAGLNSWRDKTAARHGISRDSVLPDEVVAEIAHFAPTTTTELGTIASSKGVNLSGHALEIVQVVRQTLEDLIN